MKENTEIKGTWKIIEIMDGKEVVVKEGKNLLVTVGKTQALKRLCAIDSNGVTKLGVGDSDTAADLEDTGLKGSSKNIKNISSTSSGTNTATLTTTFGSTEANYTWYEIGLFFTNDVLLTRSIITDGYIKSSGTNVRVDYTLSFT